MTKLIKKRVECLDRIIRQYGIEFGNHIFISMWDMAGNINNTWHAKDFVNIKRYPSSSKHGYVLADFCIHTMFKAIRDAVRKSGYIKLKESYNNKSEYLQITPGP